MGTNVKLASVLAKGKESKKGNNIGAIFSGPRPGMASLSLSRKEDDSYVRATKITFEDGGTLDLNDVYLNLFFDAAVDAYDRESL